MTGDPMTGESFPFSFRSRMDVSRRGFLRRLSIGTAGAYASLLGASHAAAFAASRTGFTGGAPCAGFDCTVLECHGCACGGDYYRCVPVRCPDSGPFRGCFPGHDCQEFFLAMGG